MSTLVTSATVFNWADGIYEQGGPGFAAADSFNGLAGTCVPNTLGGQTIVAAGINNANLWYPGATVGALLLLFEPGSTFSPGTKFLVTPPGGPQQEYDLSAANPGGVPYEGTSGAASRPLGAVGLWWPAQTSGLFVVGQVTTLDIVSLQPPSGHGDIPNPNAWKDANGQIPPSQFSAVPPNTNFPQNGDGRYWFNLNAHTPTDPKGPINFIGDPTFLTGQVSLQWSTTAISNDGSSLVLSYSIDGSTYTDTTISPQLQNGGIQNGAIIVDMTGSTQLFIKVAATGGTPSSTATLNTVAVAVTRNANESLPWDGNLNPLDPINYNCECMDDVVPTDTLVNLRQRLMIRLGFANQAANPPPGMTPLINDFLISGQKYLYRRYSQLHTQRLFRWKLAPGQRFYSLKDNDEDVLCTFQMDPMKRIIWAGIQDTRNVWYPFIQGIPPQLYTMVSKPWRPARYEIRQCIEVYPAPDQTYFMWFKAHFGLRTFAADGDFTTIDAELLFLHALANAKAHYGQSDANNIEAQANAYRAELIAGTHQTAHYIPGTIAIPPAVRPTLVQFDSPTQG